MLLCPARRPLLNIACAIQSGVILAHASVIVKGKTCRSHTFVESHSFYGSELEKQPSFCVFLFACQLFAHPFQNLSFAARYLYLGSTKDLCRFALGFARIKAQADELPVGFIQSFQYLRQTDHPPILLPVNPPGYPILLFRPHHPTGSGRQPA